MVWHSDLLKNFPQFVVIHTDKGFGIVHEEKVDIFLEFSCFFYEPMDVGSLISASSVFSKSNLNIWKILVPMTTGKTNLGSILESGDITLPTKVHLVQAMVFSVVMYGCERWTIKKAKCQIIDAFELCFWKRPLRVPWTARRSNQSILN